MLPFRTAVSFLLVLLVVPRCGFADGTTDAVSKLLEATGAKAQHEQMTETLLQNMESGFHNGVKSALDKQSFTSEKREMVDKLVQKHFAGFTSDIKDYLGTHLKWDDLVHKVYIPIYTKHFSVEEMQAATAFYQSDVGRKFTSSAPALMREAASQFNSLYGSEMQNYVAAAMQARVEALMADVKSMCKKDC